MGGTKRPNSGVRLEWTGKTASKVAVDKGHPKVKSHVREQMEVARFSWTCSKAARWWPLTAPALAYGAGAYLIVYQHGWSQEIRGILIDQAGKEQANVDVAVGAVEATNAVWRTDKSRLDE